MGFHPARTAATFVGSKCRRGPTCPYLRRRRCLFFHSEDEIASASEVGQDQPPVESLMARIARLEQAVSLFIGVPVPRIMEDLVDGVQAVPQELLPNLLGERSGAVPVPQTKENLVKRTQLAPYLHERVVESLDQPGDQARRDSADAVYLREQPGDQTCRDFADAVHRQGRRDGPGNQECRASADAVHRQGCRRAVGDTATGYSDTDGFEDCENPASERVQQRTVEHRIAEQTVDVPTPQILQEIVEATSAPHEQVQQRTVEHVATVKNVPQERIPEGIGVQIVDAVPHSLPQILKEVVEVVKAVKNVPVDQPGDQVRRDPQACGVATTGPSTSNCSEDVGRLARAVRQQSRESTCDHADQPGDQARRSLTDSAHEHGASGANGRGPRIAQGRSHARVTAIHADALRQVDKGGRVMPQTAVAADPQRRAVRRLAGVGE